MYKEKQGITLVALIITIIILLILATVSISLIINSGIITKSKTAVDKYSEEEIKEQIKLANSEYAMSKFTGTDKTIVEYLQERLGQIYENITITPKSETESYPITVKVKEYVYDLNNDSTVVGPIDYKKLESLYGTVVNGYTGYSATDVTEWKLFYVDEQYNEAFIVSSNAVSFGAIPLISSNGVEYTGSNNVKNFEYGRKYNKLWLEKCTDESTQTNAKATAYLCDPENWSKYVTGKAKYAAGGPTLEMIGAMAYGVQTKEISINGINSIGYPQSVNSIPDKNYRKGLFPSGNLYWVSSPSNYSSGAFVNDASGNGNMFHYSYGRKSCYSSNCLSSSVSNSNK